MGKVPILLLQYMSCLSAGTEAIETIHLCLDEGLQRLARNVPRTPRCTEDLIWFCVDTSSVVNFLNMSQNNEDICTKLIATLGRACLLCAVVSWSTRQFLTSPAAALARLTYSPSVNSSECCITQSAESTQLTSASRPWIPEVGI